MMMMRATLLFALGCGVSPVAPPAAAPAPAGGTPHALAMPDESMVFVGKLRGITVGRVRTAIGRDGWVDSKRAIIVRSRAKSEGLADMFGSVEYELQTTLDLDSSAPIEDREEAWIEVAGEQREHHLDHHTFSGNRQDVHSAVALLRGWHSAPGERASVEVSLAGGHFDVAVWDAAREQLAGKPAVRYDGTAADRFPISIWISDDAARVPLAARAETKIGEVRLDLADYDVRSED